MYRLDGSRVDPEGFEDVGDKERGEEGTDGDLVARVRNVDRAGALSDSPGRRGQIYIWTRESEACPPKVDSPR